MAIEVVAKNHLQPPKTMILPQIIWLKSSRSFILFNISFACHLYALIFYLYVLVCHSCVSRVYSYLIHMSLVCTCMSSVCHSYVLVCHPYVVLPWIQYPPPITWLIDIMRQTLKCTQGKQSFQSYITLIVHQNVY